MYLVLKWLNTRNYYVRKGQKKIIFEWKIELASSLKKYVLFIYRLNVCLYVESSSTKEKY